MFRNLSAMFWLLLVTVVLCCGVYPLALWAVGQTLLPDQANGSLITKDGKTVGSKLIAQEFKNDAYFQPRPSAASYKGEASGASNFGANNYALRDRVAQTLGPIVKYRLGAKAGQLVAPDVIAWVADHKDLVDAWVKSHPTISAALEKAKPGEPIDPAAVYFDLWRHEHPDVELIDVPADLVMASGSGLDPHITLDGALYQLDRVAGKWAELKKRDEKMVRGEIETLVRDHASAPLAGLAGVPLVNVLEVNLALRDKYGARKFDDAHNVGWAE